MVNLKTEREGNVFYAHEPVVIKAELSNPGSTERRLTLSYRITDFYDSKVVKKSRVGSITIRPKESIEKDILMPDKKGAFNFSFSAEGKVVSEKKNIRFAVISHPPHLSEEELLNSPFGILRHFGPGESLGVKAGIRWYRLGFEWNVIEPEKDKFAWRNALWFGRGLDYDGMVRQAEATESKILGLLHYIPVWLSTAPEGTDPILERRYAPKNLGVLEKKICQIVNRYKDTIKYWEFWNEENISLLQPQDWTKPLAQTYAEMLQAAYMGAKRADPSCQIVLGGLANIPVGYIEQIYEYGGKKYFDIMGIHPYYHPLSPEEGGLEKDLKALKDLMKKYGDENKEIWSTEIGYHTYTQVLDGVNEKTQADYHVRNYIISIANGIKKIFLYNFYASGNDSEGSFGIVHWPEKTPKPAYIAYNNLICQLEGAKLKKEVGLESSIKCYLFQKGNEEIATIWGVKAEGAVSIKVKPKEIEVVDIMGNEMNVQPDKKGLVKLPLLNGPIYIISRGAKGSLILALESIEVDL